MLVEAKTNTLTSELVVSLLAKSKRPIFQTTTETPVQQALIQLFVQLDPFIREVRQVVDGGGEDVYFQKQLDEEADP